MTYDPSDGMETVEELKKYVRFLYGMNQVKDRRILKMEKDMSEIKDELKEDNRRAGEDAPDSTYDKVSPETVKEQASQCPCGGTIQ